MTLAERLKMARKKKGVTIREAASALGVSGSFMSYIENGLKTPSTAVLAEMAKYYEVSADYLLGLTDQWKKWQ